MRVGQRGLLVLAFVSVSVALACGGGGGGGGGVTPGGSGTPTAGGSPTPFAGHPSGYNAATAHGPDFNAGGGVGSATGDCSSANCHGATLAGGSGSNPGPSCDSCHTGGVAWRTNCVYCHGGMNGDTTGAPPYDVLTAAEVSAGETTGNSVPNQMSFGAHLEHITDGTPSANLHPVWTCDQCHAVPTDVLSQNHIYGTTLGEAPVTFAGGMDTTAQWNRATKTCSDSYCHGDGKAPPTGTWSTFDGTPTCDQCHVTTATQLFGNLSGEHEQHLTQAGITCNDCHAGTVDTTNTIISSTLHVNGVKDVVFAASDPVTYDATAATCEGTCHSESHNAFAWQ